MRDYNNNFLKSPFMRAAAKSSICRRHPCAKRRIISIESRYVDAAEEYDYNATTSLLYDPSLPSVILIVAAIVIVVIVPCMRRLHANVVLRT